MAVVDGCVEENGGFDELSVFGCCYVKIEMKRIFSIRVDAKGEGTFECFFDRLAVTEDLLEADGEYL